MSETTLGGGGRALDFSDVRRALAVQARVLAALFLREAGIRHRQPFAIGWLLSSVEPLIMLSVISFLVTVTNHAPSYGQNMVLFVATGVFPLFIFLFTSLRVREPTNFVIPGRYPLELPLDEIIVHAVLQLISTLIVAFIFFGAMAAFGVVNAIPYDVPTLIESTSALFFFGLGVGIVAAVLTRIFPIVQVVWVILVRTTFHFSGLYFVIDYFKPSARQFFQINPVTHGINWFRHAFYPFYPDTSANPAYILFWGLVAFFLALALERMLRREHLRGERNQ